MITSVILSAISVYLIGAFASWEFNPGRWDEVSRAAFIAATACFSIVILMCRYTGPSDVSYF